VAGVVVVAVVAAAAVAEAVGVVEAAVTAPQSRSD
jgi:hypothetical protein